MLQRKMTSFLRGYAKFLSDNLRFWKLYGKFKDECSDIFYHTVCTTYSSEEMLDIKLNQISQLMYFLSL